MNWYELLYSESPTVQCACMCDFVPCDRILQRAYLFLPVSIKIGSLIVHVSTYDSIE